jgi:hypothetical protein
MKKEKERKTSYSHTVANYCKKVKGNLFLRVFTRDHQREDTNRYLFLRDLLYFRCNLQKKDERSKNNNH